MDMREVGISDVFFGEISHPGDKTKGVANCTKGFFFKKMGPCHHIYITGFSMLPTSSKIPKFFYSALLPVAKFG